MTRLAYGHTWWGAQWLQSLTEIDHDNRLPRGRSYARNGAVRDLTVKGGHIEALVQGSRPRPYTVAIDVPPTPQAVAKRLVAQLAQDPGLMARLLNGDLDPAVLAASASLGIPIFPKRWSDLGMECSCPDWAVPCKHLAAVIYLLSQEVDGDPFLVFRLRSIDLTALLAPLGVALQAEQPALASAWLPLGEDDAQRAPAVAPVGQAPDSPVTDSAASLDFTTLPDLREALWRLLPAQASFFRGGVFREQVSTAMARVAREAKRSLGAGGPTPDIEVLPQGVPVLEADDQGTVQVRGATLGGVPIGTLGDLMRAIWALPVACLADVPLAYPALRTAQLMALHLLAQGAVVPVTFAPEAKTLMLRWCAAELDGTVRELLQQLAGVLPAGLLLRKQGRKAVPLPAQHQARGLLSLMIDTLLRAYVGAEAALSKKASRPSAHDSKVLDLFFGSGLARWDGPGEGAVAGSIHAWLARFHLGEQIFKPVMQLDEVARSSAFALSLSVRDERSRLDAPTPLAHVIGKPAWADSRMGVLQTVAMLAEFHPPLNDYVRQGAKAPLTVTRNELPGLLFDTLPALRLMGARTVLPRALERLWRPRLSMQIKATSSSVPSSLSTEGLLLFDWQVSIGDERLSPEEFERLLGQAEGIVAFRGQYVMLDSQQMESLRARLARPQAIGGAELLRTALAGEYDGAPVGLDGAAAALLAELQKDEAVPLPQQLNAQLRAYQERGYAWLWRNARLGLGSVIADDMGLGKTLQVLTLLLRLKEDAEGKSQPLAPGTAQALVIVPTSLLGNWQKEAARFAPTLRVGVFHGTKREWAKELPDVLLTTYGVARSEVARLKTHHWRVLVIDEAQNIKNPAAAQTRALKSIPAAVRIAMSGTPVENRLSEYWSIMDFAQPGHLGGLSGFTRDFAIPIQNQRDARAAGRLRKVMAPFLLRRLKSDRSIINDLPDKLEQDQHCALTQEQAALYETVVREGMKALNGESRNFQRQGLVLQMILALKQICNHPAQYLKQGAADAAASGKAQRLLDLLDEVDASQGKALVFTQFREMGDLLVQMLQARHHPSSASHKPLFLHGGVPRARRDEMVERFQTDPGQRVFVLSLKAGGTGLNLTAANHVIHFDLWWNPAVEAQATDRAYRIGQQRAVQVHRFITRGTFEERINEMIIRKRDLAEMSVGTGETWIGQLPAEELRSLFELG